MVQASKRGSAAAINNIALAYFLKATIEESAETSKVDFQMERID